MSDDNRLSLARFRDCVGGFDFDAVDPAEETIEGYLEVLETLDEVAKAVGWKIDALKAAQKEKALKQIRETMFFAGITADDIVSAFKGTPLTTLEHGIGTPGKYKNPATGEEHSGRGKKAKWLQDAIDLGREVEFLNRLHPKYDEFKRKIELNGH